MKPVRCIMPIVLFSITLFIFVICLAQEKLEEPVKSGEKIVYGNGSLVYIEGIPFLKLAGDNYEMGLQYGVLMKDRLKAVMASSDYAGFKKEFNQRHWFERFYLSWRMRRHLPRKYLAELEGIAKGADVPFKDLLMGQYFNDLLALYGCSVVLTQREGKLLHGRNSDAPAFGDFPVVVEYRPTGRQGYVSIDCIGSVGVRMGMNEAGVTVSYNTGSPGRTRGIVGMPCEFILREIMESASDMKAVESLIRSYRPNRGDIVAVCSKKDKEGFIFDIDYEKTYQTGFQGEINLFATNTYIHPELTKINKLRLCPRYRTIETRLQKQPVDDVDGIIDILADPGNHICGVNNPATIHSTVFEPDTSRVYLAFANEYSAWARWWCYDWNKGTVCLFRQERSIAEGAVVP